MIMTTIVVKVMLNIMIVTIVIKANENIDTDDYDANDNRSYYDDQDDCARDNKKMMIILIIRMGSYLMI